VLIKLTKLINFYNAIHIYLWYFRFIIFIIVNLTLIAEYKYTEYKYSGYEHKYSLSFPYSNIYYNKALLYSHINFITKFYTVSPDFAQQFINHYYKFIDIVSNSFLDKQIHTR